MNGEVRIVDDVPAAFAELVHERFDRRNNDTFSLALAGGSTAPPCYEELSKQDIEWSKVELLWGDERCVPLDHPDSNYLLAKKALIDRVGSLHGVHPMKSDEGAERYEQIVASLLPLDFVHLGMGDDGHTASLFPGSPSLEERSKLVVRTGDDLHTHERLTLTYPALRKSRLCVFTIVGANKHEMFSRIQSGEDLPANRVKADEIVWLVGSEVIA